MAYWWQHTMREWRHSPCLMQPTSLIMLIIMLLFWLVTMVIALPTWLLGFLVAPIMARGAWLIEFLYPLPIARWGHLLILRWSYPKVPLEDKAANYHSRTLEQRIEVVKGRVFVHPIPQLLDNLGYLVVCLPLDPPPPTKTTAEAGDTPLGKLSVTVQYQPDSDKVPKGPIVAFLVDCGDAETVAEQVHLIRKAHYSKYPSIQIQMVLSTHKHHDHTAGNEPLKAHPKFGPCLDDVVGGAVERVPGCTLPVADGDRLKLPALGQNDMNEVAFVEVVAVPAHTRGSVVYLLRSNAKPVDAFTPPPCFAFTGDTMFSGGGGVPFEAGSDAEIDQGAYRDNAHGAIRAGVGTHAVERCFAEILVRGTMSDSSTFPLMDCEKIQNQFLIFPGHEYTTELLSRQFSPTASGSVNDANKWKNFPPHVFFETAAELYVSAHRRSLPQATGKVLAAAPTTLRKELAINPHLRSLARRAELVVQAIRLWDAYFCKPKGPRDEEAAVMRIRKQAAKPSDMPTSNGNAINSRREKADKTIPTENSWNMDSADAAKSVFTTIYTSDLDGIIRDLARGKLTAKDAADQLEGIKTKLREPVIRRRPIPGTLPSERVVLKGLIGFALLGSRPSAMTLSDSHAMKLPPPIIKDMSCILVSKKRLIAVLGHMGFLEDNADGHGLLSMIHALWQEAYDYTYGTSDELKTAGSNDSNYNAVGKRGGEESDGTASMPNDGDSDAAADLVQLGTLKWILYGFPAKQPSWFSSFCMPCGMTSSEKELYRRQGPKAQKEHPVKTSSMKRRHGELVRHDVMTCKLCNNVTGCPACEEQADDSSSAPSESDHPSLPMPISITALFKPSSSVRSTGSGRSGTGGYTATSGTAAGYTATSDTNFSAPYSADDDSVSYVDSTSDSVVEVSTIASLLTGDMQMKLDKTEEKIRI